MHPLTVISLLTLYGLVLLCAVGYALTIPGYNHRKTLRGWSAKEQMAFRYKIGRFLVQTTTRAMLIAGVNFGLANVLLPIRCEYVKVSSLSVHKISVGKFDGKQDEKESVAVIMVDGRYYKIPLEKVEFIHNGYPCVYYRSKYNALGKKLSGPDLIIRDPGYCGRKEGYRGP